MEKSMTILLDKCENRLSDFYDKLKKNPKKEFLFGLLIYTVIFAIIAAGTLGKVIYRTGTIAGGDGSEQYYPMLVDFRYNLRYLFNSLSEGHLSIKMMNFDFMFGSDTLTTSAPFFLQFLPVYILAAFIPESSLGLFYGIVTIILSYLCGITFILMCRHFNANILWSCTFAPAYIFCGNYFYTAMWNQQFLYKTLIFPVLIVGIDRILHKKNCTLFTLSIAYLALSGFIGMVYTLPFVALFAAVQLYYIDKANYLKNFFKYLLKGFLCTIVGISLSAFYFFPDIYMSSNGARTLGEPPKITKLITLSRSYISSILYQYDINGSIGVLPVFIPFLFFCVFLINVNKKHKFMAAAGLTVFSLPLIWYGLNGFMYDLCRWGYIPSCLYAFMASYYAPEMFKLKKRGWFLLALSFALFLIIMPFHLEYLCYSSILLSTIISSLLQSKYKEKILSIILFLKKRFIVKNRYLQLVLIIISVLAIILTCVVFIVSPYYDISKGVFYIFISLCILFFFSNFRLFILNKKTTQVLGAFLFSLSTIIYLITCRNELNPAHTVKDDPFLKSLASYNTSTEPLNRFSSINNESLRYITNSSFEYQKTETGPEEYQHFNPGINTSELNRQGDLALRYRYPSVSIFFSNIDEDYVNFLKKCEMDDTSLNTIVATGGYSNKEVIYSLMGVKYMYSANDNAPIYGISKDESYLYPDKYMFINEYSLPTGVTYSNVISKEDFNKFNPAELPYAMLNSVYLENNTDISNTFNKTEYSKKINFTLNKKTNSHNSSYSKHTDNTITINEDTSGGFIYLRFTGVNYTSLPSIVDNNLHIIINQKDEVITNFINNNFEWPWRSPRTEYTISLGFCSEPINKIEYMAFFEYDDVEMYYIPENVYTEGYENVCKETLENVQLSTNSLTGTINVSSDKVLCINLLHNNGWKAFIDNVETPIYKANGLFLGIKLREGTHNIKLVYRTPLLYEGIVVSLSTWIIFIIICIIKNKKSVAKKVTV